MKFWCYLDGKVRGRTLNCLSSCLFGSFKWPDIDFSAPLLPVICVYAPKAPKNMTFLATNCLHAALRLSLSVLFLYTAVNIC